MPATTNTPQRFSGDSMINPVKVNSIDGGKEELKNYIPDQDLVRAVNLAMLLEKPLLVMGEPGCGKSLLAKAIAYDLYRANMYKYYREWHIKSTSKAREGLYEFDNLRRLRDATIPNSPIDITNVDQYIRFGPMGEAFRLSVAASERAVLLIDEIDKADIDFPNDLLNELDKMEFDIQEKKMEATASARRKKGVPVKVKAAFRPIVIITSNSERDLPDAFLRRCLFHYIKPLSDEKLKQIIEGRYYENQQADALADDALALFVDLRNTIKDELLSVGKNISTSEFLDWFEALKHYHDLKQTNKPQAGEVKAMFDELDKLQKKNIRQIPFQNILLKNLNAVIRFNEPVAG